MTGEQIVSVRIPGEVAHYDNGDVLIDVLKKLIQNAASDCVDRRYPDGNVPSGQFTLLYPIGREFRHLPGNDDAVEVEIALGLSYGSGEVEDSVTHDKQSVCLNNRFYGIGKVAIRPDVRYSVRVGKLPNGSDAQGMPLAFYTFGPVSCGIYDDPELQAKFEDRYLSSIGSVVAVAADGCENDPVFRKRFEQLEQSDQSLRSTNGETLNKT